MTPPIASPASQTITAIVFGFTATIISIVTVWQSYRVFTTWHESRRLDQVENTESDIELGLRSNDQPPSPTERFELPAYPWFPNVAPVEAGSALQPSNEPGAELSIVPVGIQETSTTPDGIN